MSDYANMLESIRGLASSLHAINQKAVRAYTPVVEAILRSPIPDTRHIERTLDGLLDFCGYEPAASTKSSAAIIFTLTQPRRCNMSRPIVNSGIPTKRRSHEQESEARL